MDSNYTSQSVASLFYSDVCHKTTYRKSCNSSNKTDSKQGISLDVIFYNMNLEKSSLICICMKHFLANYDEYPVT